MVTLFLRRAASRRAALSLSLCRRWSAPKKSVEKIGPCSAQLDYLVRERIGSHKASNYLEQAQRGPEGGRLCPRQFRVDEVCVQDAAWNVPD